jgi:hypothetical protein
MSPAAQRVNCWADKLATAALIAAVEANEFISSIFRSEKGCIEIAKEWVTGSPKMQSQSFGENRWPKYCMTDGGWYARNASHLSTGRAWSVY